MKHSISVPFQNGLGIYHLGFSHFIGRVHSCILLALYGSEGIIQKQNKYGKIVMTINRLITQIIYYNDIILVHYINYISEYDNFIKFNISYRSLLKNI